MQRVAVHKVEDLILVKPLNESVCIQPSPVATWHILPSPILNRSVIIDPNLAYLLHKYGMSNKFLLQDWHLQTFQS